MGAVHDYLINSDVLLGRFLPFRLPAYIQEDILTEGSGVYSVDEWSRARSLGYRDAGPGSRDLDTNEAYVARLLSKHRRNTLAAMRLINTFDFRRYRSVLELGCGEMVQALVIKSTFPDIRYKATDFDPYVIDKCRKLTLLQSIDKDVLDVSKLTEESLSGFDLLISWEMNYALSDTNLTSLLRAVKEAGIPYLTCGTQHVGPIRYLVRNFKNLNWRPGGFYYERMVRQKKLRMHGWQTSIAHYRRVAARVGLKLGMVAVPPVARPHEDNFVYCLLVP